MTASRRNLLARLAFLLAGLAPVALALAWSALRPSPVPLLVEGGTFALGTTARGDYRRHSWLIRNRGPAPLRLRTRFTSGRCGFSLWLGEDYVVPPGGFFAVALTIPTPLGPAVPFAGHADVLTDDPETPRLRFRLFGITGP